MFSNTIIIFFINKTALYLAVENQNLEIVQLLLTRNNIDINAKTIIYSN